MSALAAATRPADQSTDDLDLVAAVRAGDDRAFELLWNRYQARITAYVRGKVRDQSRAEDITQEVFISALRRMRETDRQINFRPWLYEIAKNACIDAFRRSRGCTEVSIDADDALGPADHGRLADSGPAPDAVIDTKLAIDNLCGAMGEMSPAHRDVLVMREFEGLSYREIGDRLGMSGPAVESTLFRARRRLGEEYDELVSGERCVRVRSLVDAGGGRTAGLRDRRCLARHLSHCQPCRRYALHAGVEVAALRAPAAVRIAALLPLPAFLRRRQDPDEAGQVLGAHSPALNIVSTLDPSVVSCWSKAIVTAATVVVAGLGAGAAVEHEEITDLISRAPAMVGLSPGAPAAKAPPAARGLQPARARGSRFGAPGIVVEPRTGRVSTGPGGAVGTPAPRIPTAAPGVGPGEPDAPPSGSTGGGVTGSGTGGGGAGPQGAAPDLGATLTAPGDATKGADPAVGLDGLVQGAGSGTSTGAAAPAVTAETGASNNSTVNSTVSGLTGTATATGAGATGAGSSGSGDAPGEPLAQVGAAAPAAPDPGSTLTVISRALGTPAGPT